MIDIEKVLSGLTEKRKIFSSEADFQLAIAWELKLMYPGIEIRMEYCPYEVNKDMHIDILVIKDGLWIPIELKYKTKGGELTYDNEKYYLKNHGAQDLGRYDFIKDISRIEYVKNHISNYGEGYAILLTNDNVYMSKSSNQVIYKEFSLGEGVIKRGTLSWNVRASKGTTKGREKPLYIEGTYLTNWKTFSEIDDKEVLKYLCIKI